MLGTAEGAALRAGNPTDVQNPGVAMQSQNYVPPQNELQQVIAGVWQEMFHSERSASRTISSIWVPTRCSWCSSISGCAKRWTGISHW